MSDWQDLGAIANFPPDRITPVRVAGEDLVVVRRGDELACFRDRCSHQDVRLSEFGEILASKLVCHAHGAEFDCLSGRHLSMPATAPLEAVPIELRDGTLFIDRDEV